MSDNDKKLQEDNKKAMLEIYRAECATQTQTIRRISEEVIANLIEKGICDGKCTKLVKFAELDGKLNTANIALTDIKTDRITVKKDLDAHELKVQETLVNQEKKVLDALDKSAKEIKTTYDAGIQELKASMKELAEGRALDDKAISNINTKANLVGSGVLLIIGASWVVFLQWLYTFKENIILMIEAVKHVK